MCTSFTRACLQACFWHGDFTRWHPKRRRRGHPCHARRSWRTGCCPLALTSTLSTTCTSFPKVCWICPMSCAKISFQISQMYCIVWENFIMITNKWWSSRNLKSLLPLFATSEHEARLQREFQLERGLLEGYKRVRLQLSKNILRMKVKNHTGGVPKKIWGKKNVLRLFFFKIRIHWILNGVSGLSGPRNRYCGLSSVMAWHQDWWASFAQR